MFHLAYILKAAVQIGQNFGVQLFHDVDYFIQCSGLQTKLELLLSNHVPSHEKVGQLNDMDLIAKASQD